MLFDRVLAVTPVMMPVALPEITACSTRGNETVESVREVPVPAAMVTPTAPTGTVVTVAFCAERFETDSVARASARIATKRGARCETEVFMGRMRG